MTVVIDVVSGSVVNEPADAIITGINSKGTWIGGVDHAIMQVAGQTFHDQARAAMPLKDGDAVFAVSNGHGAIKNVLFVVDDLKRPLGELATIALQAAEAQRLHAVVVPAMRTGMATGLYERTVEEVVHALCGAAHKFAASSPKHLKHIRFVVRGDPSMESFFEFVLNAA